MVGKVDTLTHSALYINHTHVLEEYMRHTLINRPSKLIMGWVESGCDVPSQLGTDDISLIRIIHVQVAEGIFGLKKLKYHEDKCESRR